MDRSTFADESWGKEILKHKIKLEEKVWGTRKFLFPQIVENYVAFRVGAEGQERLGLETLRGTRKGTLGHSFQKPLYSFPHR